MKTQTPQSITQTLAHHLAEGTIATEIFSEAMTHHFGRTDAQGKWNWKLASRNSSKPVGLFICVLSLAKD